MNQPAIGGGNSEGISIGKIENGYQIHHSSESKKLSADGNNFLYDYLNETFAFSTQEETIAKLIELLAAL